MANYDFSASKRFRLTRENLYLKFAAEFFNLFNHTNFANPVLNQSNANFGRITATVGSTAPSAGTTGGALGGGPRIIQFSLRLQF